jgi:hypothetical protein
MHLHRRQNDESIFLKFSKILSTGGRDKGEQGGVSKINLQKGDLTFEAFTAAMFQVEVLWVVTPCSVVVGYQRFRDQCCLHLQGEGRRQRGLLKSW